MFVSPYLWCFFHSADCSGILHGLSLQRHKLLIISHLSQRCVHFFHNTTCIGLENNALFTTKCLCIWTWLVHIAAFFITFKSWLNCEEQKLCGRSQWNYEQHSYWAMNFGNWKYWEHLILATFRYIFLYAAVNARWLTFWTPIYTAELCCMCLWADVPSHVTPGLLPLTADGSCGMTSSWPETFHEWKTLILSALHGQVHRHFLC